MLQNVLTIIRIYGWYCYVQEKNLLFMYSIYVKFVGYNLIFPPFPCFIIADLQTVLFA
jgi:hypothetical protein